MTRIDRIFDLIDPAVKRPGMFVKEPFILGIFELMYRFDYALFMAESYDKRDRGEEFEFIQTSISMQRLIDFLCEELNLDCGKFSLGQKLLASCDGDDESAMELFRNLYIEFRGADYCRYMPGGSNEKINA